MLQKLEIFGSVDCPAFFEQLGASLDEVFLPAEHLIVRQGQQLHSLYILVSGRIKFQVHQVTLAELTEGACLGELSVLDHQPSPVSIHTLEPCHFLMLSEQALLKAIQVHPGVSLQMTQGLYKKVCRFHALA